VSECFLLPHTQSHMLLEKERTQKQVPTARMVAHTSWLTELTKQRTENEGEIPRRELRRDRRRQISHKTNMSCSYFTLLCVTISHRCRRLFQLPAGPFRCSNQTPRGGRPAAFKVQESDHLNALGPFLSSFLLLIRYSMCRHIVVKHVCVSHVSVPLHLSHRLWRSGSWTMPTTNYSYTLSYSFNVF